MILSTFLTAAALFGGPTAVLVQGNTSAATAEGVEILRRFLADSLDDTFSRTRLTDSREKGEDEDKDGRETRIGKVRSFGNYPVIQSLWTSGQTVEHSRAFHLPDVGVFVTLDAALPMVDKAEAPKKDDPRSKDDEWERMRREVRGGGRNTVFLQRFPDASNSEIDPQAIERTIETVIKTVARYGTRVEGMAPQETITVALRITGRHHEWTFDQGSPDEDGSEDPERVGTYHSLSVLMATDDSVQKNLVVRVALGDLVNYTEGGYERLRQRAQVNVY